jgi:hypothetical protein
MKKLYFLDEQEKERILNLHTEATKQQYLVNKKILNEAASLPVLKNILTKINKSGKVDDLLNKMRSKSPTINKSLFSVFDDFLAKNEKYVFVSTKKGTAYFKDLDGNIHYLENILTNMEKLGPNPTEAQIQRFIGGLPNQITARDKSIINNFQDDILNRFQKKSKVKPTGGKSTGGKSTGGKSTSTPIGSLGTKGYSLFDNMLRNMPIFNSTAVRRFNPPPKTYWDDVKYTELKKRSDFLGNRKKAQELGQMGMETLDKRNEEAIKTLIQSLQELGVKTLQKANEYLNPLRSIKPKDEAEHLLQIAAEDPRFKSYMLWRYLFPLRGKQKVIIGGLNIGQAGLRLQWLNVNAALTEQIEDIEDKSNEYCKKGSGNNPGLMDIMEFDQSQYDTWANELYNFSRGKGTDSDKFFAQFMDTKFNYEGLKELILKLKNASNWCHLRDTFNKNYKSLVSKTSWRMATSFIWNRTPLYDFLNYGFSGFLYGANSTFHTYVTEPLKKIFETNTIEKIDIQKTQTQDAEQKIKNIAKIIDQNPNWNNLCKCKLEIYKTASNLPSLFIQQNPGTEYGILIPVDKNYNINKNFGEKIQFEYFRCDPNGLSNVKYYINIENLGGGKANIDWDSAGTDTIWEC